jgi:DUF4097 and DUF4098 domain-containing protein YvlB
MKKQLSIFGIILLLLLAGLTGCIGLVSKEFNAEYIANENTILKVTNINGEIKIVSWNSNNVSIHAVTESFQGNDELEKIRIEVVEINDLIDIETKFLGTGSVKASTDMTIKVPTFITVDNVTTSNGEVRISGTKGNITAHSSNGDMIIEDVDGYVKVSSSNGKIEVKETTGIDDLHTSNGEIHTEIFDFKDDVNITSSNGKITVYINPSLNADIEMRTSNGDISMSGVTLTITRSEEKHMEGTLGEGGNKIFIQTSNGDIQLYNLEN